ncbi:hypothetical protein GH810_05930 [Acetobacterium paludosum]|uniref:Uncharacterized protein n=1 Tax=Acetobacterium paludosum TaxID=52693 RepID=A0A923HV64_9FIRM|nr:hypothetical protein [Acetobacterium paludosum]MBC3887845.1 hypothetical protein [Acetobacterium paludosum]
MAPDDSGRSWIAPTGAERAENNHIQPNTGDHIRPDPVGAIPNRPQRLATRQRIWLHTQYLTLLEDQEAILYAATPATRQCTRERIALAKAWLEEDAAVLVNQTQALMAVIDGLIEPRVQEIMARRYLKNQPFADIAAAMAYDLRWVYRLHQRGLLAADGSSAI